MNHYLEKNEPLSIDNILTNAHEYFYRKYYGKSNINCVIPIMKHLEWCRNVVEVLKVAGIIGLKETQSVYNIYNEDVLENLQKIESNGLQTVDGMVYSEYNPYTATGRPSNRFGGLNFAALNKKDGSRKKFVSRYGKEGMLVEMDYDAYHLRLIGEVVDYQFPKGSVHNHMAKLYDTDYEEAKSLSFQFLYGHILEELLLFLVKLADHEVTDQQKEVTVKKSSNEWVEKLEKVGVPCGPINSIDKVFDDPQVKHLGIAQSIETIPFGKTELVGQPFNLSRSPSSLKQRPPEKGEHNKDVLSDLGFTDIELNDFQSKNII